MNELAKTPLPPYYTVIFTSIRTEGDNGYNKMSDHMTMLVAEQKGFLGVESAKNEIGITVSYWKDLQSIKDWKENVEHSLARSKGKSDWYGAFKVRIAKVEIDYGFEK